MVSASTYATRIRTYGQLSSAACLDQHSLPFESFTIDNKGPFHIYLKALNLSLLDVCTHFKSHWILFFQSQKCVSLLKFGLGLDFSLSFECAPLMLSSALDVNSFIFLRLLALSKLFSVGNEYFFGVLQNKFNFFLVIV